VARRIMSMKNSNDTIGNRTHDLPACSAVPQPTAPPRTPTYPITILNFRVLAHKFGVRHILTTDGVFIVRLAWPVML